MIGTILMTRLNCPDDSERRTTPDPTDCSRSWNLGCWWRFNHFKEGDGDDDDDDDDDDCLSVTREVLILILFRNTCSISPNSLVLQIISGS